jgi:hypothetical protein
MSNEGNGPDNKSEPFVFPAWHNKVPAIFALVIGPVVTVLAIGIVWYYFSPKHTDVGYMPVQPVQYSHALHAGELQIDCRYCHSAVEYTGRAGVPPTQTCMNCHRLVETEEPKLAKVRESCIPGYKAGDDLKQDCDPNGAPIPWVRIHKTPDYAYFEHSPHMQAGVGCESCHGRVDKMVEVSQQKPLSMGWCYDCHKMGQDAYHAELTAQKAADAVKVAKADGKDVEAAEATAAEAAEDSENAFEHFVQHASIRPKDKVTVMGYQFNKADYHQVSNQKGQLLPPIHCSGCHR